MGQWEKLNILFTDKPVFCMYVDAEIELRLFIAAAVESAGFVAAKPLPGVILTLKVAHCLPANRRALG